MTSDLQLQHLVKKHHYFKLITLFVNCLQYMLKLQNNFRTQQVPFPVIIENKLV